MTLKVGIVGAGIRGALFAEALWHHTDTTVVGIADFDAALAERVAARFDARASGSVETLLDHDDVDAVVIATPDFAHRDAAVAAARRGKHLLVEKPLAMTMDDAEAIAEAAETAGVRLVVGFENRWNPRFIAAREQLLASGGPVRSQVVHLNDTTFVPTRMLSWAGRSSPAWFLMPHSLDLAIWMSRRVPTEVFAQGIRGRLADRGVDTWDGIDAFVRFDDGSTTVLHSNWVLPESFPAVYDLRYEALADGLAIRVVAADQGVHTYGDRATWTQWGTYVKDGRLHGFPVDMAHAFADALNGADLELPGPADGLIVTRTIAAIDRSLASGTPVAV